MRPPTTTALAMLAGTICSTGIHAAHEPGTAKNTAPQTRPHEEPLDRFDRNEAFDGAGTDQPYGTAGQASWTFHAAAGGGAVESGIYAGAQITYDTFMADGFQLSLGIEGWNLEQRDGDDAVGGGAMAGVRYHFVRNEEAGYTLFAGVGIGIAITNEPVADADGGSDVNFTPRAGVGATVDLRGEARLVAELRWQHLSNARVFGSDRNPGRDAGVFSIGVSIPTR